MPEMGVVCCARPIRSLVYFIPGVGRAWGGAYVFNTRVVASGVEMRR